MNQPLRIDTLAVRLCHAVREARGEDKAWVGIDCLSEFLGGSDASTIDAALAFAGAKGWVSISGKPADRVLLSTNAP